MQHSIDQTETYILVYFIILTYVHFIISTY